MAVGCSFWWLVVLFQPVLVGTALDELSVKKLSSKKVFYYFDSLCHFLTVCGEVIKKFHHPPEHICGGCDVQVFH